MERKKDFRENDHVQLWIEDGVIHEYFKDHVKRITIEMAKEIVSDRLKVSNGVTMPILIYSNNVRTLDKEANDYFTTEESTQYLSASATVIDNYVTMILTKLFIALNPTKFKSEIFRSKKKALEWLQHYKNLN